ncbi:MAG: YidC/Oxa1 family insertase periplasmic-domain containing protein [candidate division WOR-3 bacterium]
MNSDNLRMLVGFAIIMVILILWQLLLPGRTRTTPLPAPAPVESLIVQSQPQTPVLTTPTEPEYQYRETSFTLSNRFLEVTISSRSAAINSCYLKNYRVQLIPEGQTILGIKELAQSLLSGYQTTDTSITLQYHTAPGRLTLTWLIGDDYTLQLLLDAESTLNRLTFDARGGIATTEANLKEDLANFHFYARTSGKVHQIAALNLRRKPFSAVADWAGLKSKYFFAALVNQTGIDSCRAEALPDGRIGMQVIHTISGDPGRYLIYLGPIEYNRLRRFGLGFENVVSLGWLKPIALAILFILRLFYQLVRNWGGAIVLFSLVMKLIFYPLTRTQTRQMRQLQLLQPKLEELKKKYKDDPQQLNQETMRLYQLYRVNPLSGCLPLLVQMPVFFALYAVLRNFIELRGAGFILWLRDLSQPDTLFGHIPRGVPLVGGFALGLLPILMGVSFIAQNLLTATDKKNWALTVIFPIFITAIFLNLSSGLQLYWFIYNILSIGESLIATKGGSLWQKIRKAPNPGGN